MKKILLLTTITASFLLSGCTKNYVDPYYPPDNTYEFVDEFVDNRNDWNFADNVNDAYGIVSNGTYSLNYLDPNGIAYYMSKNIQFNPDRNFVIQSRIGSDNNMGLLFGHDAASGAFGYSFTISVDGYFALYDEGGNGGSQDITEIIAPRTASYVNGNGNWNEVKVEQVGNNWIGYINGYQAFTVPARYIVKGSVGFVVVGNTRGEADYLQANYY